jgi:hypothetical protein
LAPVRLFKAIRRQSLVAKITLSRQSATPRFRWCDHMLANWLATLTFGSWDQTTLPLRTSIAQTREYAPMESRQRIRPGDAADADQCIALTIASAHGRCPRTDQRSD